MPLKSPPSRGHIVLALAALVVLASLGAWWLWHTGLTPADVMAEVKKVTARLSGLNPVFYVLAVAVLPYVGVPSSFLYPLGGSAYGPAAAVGWTALGLALNLPIGYFVGAWWLREPIARWMERQGRKLPEVPPGEFGRLVVLTRVIPGPPLIAQNFLLALAGVPFRQYYLLSLPICTFFAVGILLAANGVLNGNAKLAITGICAIVALSLLAHVVKTIFERRKAKKPVA